MKLKIFCIAIIATICAWADIAISPSSIDYAVGGGGAAVKTSGSGSWTATTDVDWVTLVKSSGDAGASCTYIVSRNNSADVREGHITISGNIYTVTQKGCPITLTPSSIAVDKMGSSGKITASVDAGVTWTATPSDVWITVLPTSGSGAAELSYSIAEYNAVGSRNGTIRIGSEKFTITQTGIDVTLSPVATNITKDVCIVPLQVVALTETKWTVTPNASWISVLDGGNGYGGSQVTLAVAENPSFEKRVGTVAIGTALFTVTQSGTDDVNFKILPEVATASPKGAFANVAVYATPDASWTAESMDSWIKITEGESGAGNGNVKYVTMSNPELEPRTGRIKFTPPIVEPEFDLYAGLMFWIQSQTNIEGNDARATRYILSKSFDGSFCNELTGEPIPSCENRGYTYSVSFMVGAIDQVNRLLKIGSHSVYIDSDNVLNYHEIPTTFVVNEVNQWYTLVFRVSSNYLLTIYAGKKDCSLAPVLSCALQSYLAFDASLPMSTFKLGCADQPSTGYLQSGQFANLRFWTRSLTDSECINVDVKQNVALESKQIGAPDDCKYYYFSMNGNTLVSDELDQGSVKPIGKVQSVGMAPCEGRDKIYGHGVGSEGDGLITITNYQDLFSGTGHWCAGATPHYNPYGNNSCSWNGYATFSGEFDATLVMWVNIKSYPQTGETQIIRRIYTGDESSHTYYNIGSDLMTHTVHAKKAYNYQQNRDLGLGLSSSGYLTWKIDNAVNETFSTVRIPTNEWVMISFVGKNQKSVTVYLNDQDIGNVSSSATFGWLPRHERDTGTDCNEYSLKIGGWVGEIDELTIYRSALAGKDIKAIYNSGQPFQYAYHTVNQGVQELTIMPDNLQITKFGCITNIKLSVARAINWTAKPNNDWISVVGETAGTGPSTLVIKAEANPTCLPRIGTVTIGTKTLTINQGALDCEVSANKTIFPTEADETGGMGMISVTPEGNGSWTAESDVSWIYCYPESGKGSYDVYFFVEDMGSTAACRSGKITIGGQTIEITQRGYELSIDPKIGEVGGNAGAGVIGVAADDGAIWTAIADVPWITIVQTTDKFVHYTFTDNTTGETRIGHINISGSTYTLTQTCKLDLNATVVGKGTITGGGKYAQGANVSLTATPAAGYEFSHWSGDVVGVDAQTSVIMDSVKNVTATFIPESAAQVLAEKKAAQGGFYTRDQIHNLEMGNLILDVDATTGKARIGVQLQETSDLSNPNWQPVNVSTGDLDVGADGTVGIKASATGNAKFFRVVTPNK